MPFEDAKSDWKERKTTGIDLLLIRQLGEELMEYAEKHGYTEEQFLNTIWHLAALYLSLTPEEIRDSMLRKLREVSNKYLV